MSILGQLKGRINPTDRQSVVRNATRAAPVQLPQWPANMSTQLRDYFQRLHESITTGFSERTPDIGTRDSVFLRSPNGSVFEIQVTDAGAIQTVKQVEG